MNYILRCVCEDYETYVISNKVVAFEIDAISNEKDPIVESVRFRGADGCSYFCYEIEILFKGMTIAYMSFNENEKWRKSEIFKILEGVFK